MLTWFITLSFLLTLSTWILFGFVAAFTSLVNLWCQEIDEVLADPSSSSDIDCVRVSGSASDATNQIRSGIENALTAANAYIQSTSLSCIVLDDNLSRVIYPTLNLCNTVECKCSFCTDANENSNNLAAEWHRTCGAFNVFGSSYSSLCDSSGDAELLSSIYQCVSPEKENIANFNIDGKLLPQ